MKPTFKFCGMLLSFKKIMILGFALIFSLQADAQLHIGLSANIGNWLSYTPDSPGLRTPANISGSLVLALEQKLKNDWFIQYEADLGVLGYYIQIDRLDTLYDPHYDETTVFGNYYSLYGNFGILAGKEMSIGKKTLMISVGGGASFYFPENDFGCGIGTSIDDDSGTIPDYIQVFRAETTIPATSAQPFVKVLAQIKLNSKASVGLGYTHHFKSILEGEYEFYNTETPSSGTISLYPRELNRRLCTKFPGTKPKVAQSTPTQKTRHTSAWSFHLPMTYLTLQTPAMN